MNKFSGSNFPNQFAPMQPSAALQHFSLKYNVSDFNNVLAKETLAKETLLKEDTTLSFTKNIECKPDPSDLPVRQLKVLSTERQNCEKENLNEVLVEYKDVYPINKETILENNDIATIIKKDEEKKKEPKMKLIVEEIILNMKKKKYNGW